MASQPRSSSLKSSPKIAARQSPSSKQRSRSRSPRQPGTKRKRPDPDITADERLIAEALALADELLDEQPKNLFEAYLAQDKILVNAGGFHATSDWWLGTLEDFWLKRPSSVYRLVLEVGRRGGKSVDLARVAAVETVDREWSIPAGDPDHVFAFFSVIMGEAKDRLSSVEKIFQVRRVYHYKAKDERGHYIGIIGRRLKVRAMAASFRTSVGFTLIGAVHDELARWHDKEASANPAKYILSSVRPAIATHLNEGAHEYLSSSPWAAEGSHYDAVTEGNDDQQMVARAATWVTNPTLTVGDCERLCEAEQEEGEPSDLHRDYGNPDTGVCEAMPLTAVGKLDPALVDWLEAPPDNEPGDLVVSGSDLGMRKNSSTQSIGFVRGEHYYVRHIEEWQPLPGKPLRPSAVCKEQADRLHTFGATATMADQHYRESLDEELSNAGLILLDAPQSPVPPLTRLRALLWGGRLHVYADPVIKSRLTKQFRGTRLVPTQNGLSVQYETGKDGAHGDLVAALSLMCWQQTGEPVKEPTKPRTYQQRMAQQEVEKRIDVRNDAAGYNEEETWLDGQYWDD